MDQRTYRRLFRGSLGHVQRGSCAPTVPSFVSSGKKENYIIYPRSLISIVSRNPRTSSKLRCWIFLSNRSSRKKERNDSCRIVDSRPRMIGELRVTVQFVRNGLGIARGPCSIALTTFLRENAEDTRSKKKRKEKRRLRSSREEGSLIGLDA